MTHFLNKIPNTITRWNNGKTGEITYFERAIGQEFDRKYKFVETDSSTGDYIYGLIEQETKSQIIAIGFVAYWLGFRHVGTKKLFTDYSTKKLNQYKDFHKCDIDICRRNLEQEFYGGEHIKIEEQYFEKSKALIEFIGAEEFGIINDYFLEYQFFISQRNFKNESVKVKNEKRKRIFISYSHDSEEHKMWVQKLANSLEPSFEVLIDSKLPLGGDIDSFMEQIEESDRVLLVLTPSYKRKADERKNGVGYEAGVISSEIYNEQGTCKFIPIIRDGDIKKSTPKYLGNRNSLDMTNEKNFENNIKILINDILNN